MLQKDFAGGLLNGRDQTTLWEGERAAVEPHYQAMRQVVVLMREQYAEPLTLANLADAACLSPFYFNRIFHRAIGIPPGEFLSALRLGAAKQLLLTTELSVTDICFAVGYNALGSFTSRFTQQVGISPRYFRQHITRAQDELDAPVERAPVPSALLGRQRILNGHVSTPEPFKGIIFVGVFPRPIPRGKPICCTQLAAPGAIRLGPVPEGVVYVLSAAFPFTYDLTSYLLPENMQLVGNSGPLFIHDGMTLPFVDLRLRRPGLVDPPILTALLPGTSVQY